MYWKMGFYVRCFLCRKLTFYVGRIFLRKMLSFYIEGIYLSWVWWHRPGIAVLERPRQKDLKFKTNRGFRANWMSAWNTKDKHTTKLFLIFRWLLATSADSDWLARLEVSSAWTAVADLWVVDASGWSYSADLCDLNYWDPDYKDWNRPKELFPNRSTSPYALLTFPSHDPWWVVG